MASTVLLLVTGAQLEVQGPMSDVAKALENAARSGAGTAAGLTDASSREPVGVYTAHVVSIRPGAE
jgi:hypothetical protein